MSTKLYDKYGTLVHRAGLTRDAFFISMGIHLTQEETKNKDLVLKIIMQCAMDTLLQPFFSKINGYNKLTDLQFAKLSDVKGKAELADFETQAKEIARATKDRSVEAFKTTAAQYVPYWEKAAAYTGEGEVNEVKRAAYQNLATYYILTGDIAKANEYIALYKPIDKVISMMFGLIKYKESESLEKLITELYPLNGAVTPSASTQLMSLNDIVDCEKFLTLDGTIVLKGKNPGTYSGKFKISLLPTGGSEGNIVSLDAPSDNLIIETKDDAGNPKKIGAAQSNIELIKTTNGDQYTYQVFDQTFGIGGQGVIMKSTFTSPSVTIFRTILPEDRPKDYYILKASDPKGLKYTDSKARKKLIEFFADCPDLAEKLKNETISKDEKEEMIVEMYSKCRQ